MDIKKKQEPLIELKEDKETISTNQSYPNKRKGPSPYCYSDPCNCKLLKLKSCSNLTCLFINDYEFTKETVSDDEEKKKKKDGAYK